MVAPINNYPLVVRVMLQFKAALLAGEIQQIERMSRQWLQVERNLQGQIDALALEIAQLQAAGETVGVSKLIRMERYKTLIAQAKDELRSYGRYAAGEIERGQLAMIRTGISNAVESLKAYFSTYGRVAGAFDILPVNAMEFMVGLAGDGSPLYALLKKSWPDAIEGLTTQLINATALGKNPRETARAMRKGFGVGFQRSINIARTEQLRVYRESSREQYKASGLVAGYKRLSARDSRVCPACLFADDGTVYSLDTPFEEHPQGRCTQIPVVKGMPEVQWQNGQAWFTSQNEATKRSILGAGRYEGWKAGQFELSDVVKRVENDTWGTSLVPTALKDLLGE